MSKRGNGNYANASYQSRSKSGRDSFTVGNCLLWPGNAVSTWWVRFISKYNKMLYQMSPHLNYLTSESFDSLSVCLLPLSQRASPQREKLGVGCVQNVLHGSNMCQVSGNKWKLSNDKQCKAKPMTEMTEMLEGNVIRRPKACLVHQKLITAIVFIPSVHHFGKYKDRKVQEAFQSSSHLMSFVCIRSFAAFKKWHFYW